MTEKKNRNNNQQSISHWQSVKY